MKGCSLLSAGIMFFMSGNISFISRQKCHKSNDILSFGERDTAVIVENL